MTRSLKKFVYINKYTFYKVKHEIFSEIGILKNFRKEAVSKNWFLNKNLFVLWSKNDTVLPFMVGYYFLVYNGHSFNLLFINLNMVGHKVGEFVLTTKIGIQIHNLKKNKDKIK